MTKKKGSKSSIFSNGQKNPAKFKNSLTSTGEPSLIFSTCLDHGEDDGSQAWCIVMCCFLVNVMVMGFLKCLGILIIDLQKEFKANLSQVSILVSVTTCLNSIAGPVACYLVMKFTTRTVSFIGMLLVSFGLMLSYFATSIQYLYFSIGVLVGIGSGLTYSPGIILVGNYFQKSRRGMANGVVASGSPVGMMLMPYTLNFLTTYLDCQGALLILGGLMLHGVVCTLSYKPYRPPGKRKHFITSIDGSNEKTVVPVSFEDNSPPSPIVAYVESSSDDSSGPEFVDDIHPMDFFKPKAPSTGSVIVYKINEKYGISHYKHDPQKPHLLTKMPPLWSVSPPKEPSELGKIPQESLIAQNIKSKASKTDINPKENKIMHPFSARLRAASGSGSGSGVLSTIAKLRSRNSGSKVQSNNLTGTPTRIRAGSVSIKSGDLEQIKMAISGSKDFVGSSTEFTVRNRRATITSWNEPSTPLFSPSKKLDPYILSLDHSCLVMWSNDNLALTHKKANIDSSLDQSHISGDGDAGRAIDIVQILPEKKHCCARFMSFIWNSPLGKPIYLILLFSNSSTAIATTNILLQIPALAQHRGLSKNEASTVYLIVSLFDLTGRLLGAFMYDRKYLASTTLFSAGLILSGMSSFGIGLCGFDFPKLACFSALFGLSCGSHIGIFGALMAEIVGVSLLPVGLAFCMILNGILQFSFINISGKVLSIDPDAYGPLYYFYGTTLLVGGSLWFIPISATKIRRLTANYRRKQIILLPDIEPSTHEFGDSPKSIHFSNVVNNENKSNTFAGAKKRSSFKTVPI